MSFKQIKFSLFIATVLTLSGCGNKKDFADLLQGDVLYSDAVAYTKHATMNDGEKTVVTISITYLNQLFKDRYNEDEYFLVGVDIEDGKNRLDPDGLYLFLAGMEPLKVTKVDRSELKNLPMINSWSQYYRVSFAQTDLSNLPLSFHKPGFENAHLSIIKDRGR